MIDNACLTQTNFGCMLVRRGRRATLSDPVTREAACR